MSGFKAISDQKRSIELLKIFLRKRALPHALLFTGNEGVGKRTCALAVAMSCNCLETDGGKDVCEPCGRCVSCRKIESDIHPDIVRIKRTGQFIKVSRIRSLGKSLALKPYEARKRVVIISRARDMNPEASSALLKMLEEPSNSDVFILTARRTSDLLPTIVSRCHHIRFNPISPEILAMLLIKKKGISPDKAKKIAFMAHGSFTRAVSLCETDWAKRRIWLINEISSLDSRPTGLVMAFAEKLSRNSGVAGESLEIILSFLRDLIVVKYDSDKIINKDMTDKISKASFRLSTDQIIRRMELVGNARKKINENANLRLLLEALFIKFANRDGKKNLKR